jgi:hypothetical protein
MCLVLYLKEVKMRSKSVWKEKKNLIFNSIFAILTLMIPILFYKNVVLATTLLLIVAVIGLSKWKSKLTLAIFVFGAIFGGVAEILAIYFGIWSYAVTNLWNIPSWLLIVWGNAAAFIYQTAVEFRKLGVKDKK